MKDFKKTHLMPLVMEVTPPTLTLPNTAPVAQKRVGIGGMLRWVTPEWNKEEYERVERAVNLIMSECKGKQIEDFVMELAKAAKRIIPDRNFSINLGSFGIEHKVKEGKK